MEFENRLAALRQAQGASQEIDLPDSIAGLDLTSLRTRLGDNEEVIATILRQFMSDFDPWPAAFDLACAGQDMATMKRLVHTLKGTALNISAPRLQEAALLLETALRDGRGAQPLLVLDCRQALQELLQALRVTLPQPQWQAEAKASEPQQQQVIGQLRELLQRRRMVSLTLQQQVRAVLAPLVSGERLDTLLDQLARFEYQQALQTLTEIEQHMK